jgi:ADP-heptose:LPS heptosyltransferase
MGWKGDLVDIPLGLVARLLTPRVRPLPKAPSIFILRNNDIGDLLVTTPLFDALRRRFPESEIVVGTGAWNRETLRGNPHISDVVEVNAPWNNKYVADQGWPAVARYLAFSPELSSLRDHFDVGIDVVGSHVGSALMLRLGIPYRLGVRGYRGGHTAVQQFVQYNEAEHVGRSALRFAELLGATDLPEVRPQIFLSDAEREAAQQLWPRVSNAPRIALGIGAGFPEKCWPTSHWVALVKLLTARGWDVALVGGKGDIQLGAQLSALGEMHDFTGKLTLRETFAVTETADAVITNPSMLLHVAAAFHKPTVVVLGEYYTSGEAHDRQWGYPSCISLGKEAGGYAAPSRVLEVLIRLEPSIGTEDPGKGL